MVRHVISATREGFTFDRKVLIKAIKIIEKHSETYQVTQDEIARLERLHWLLGEIRDGAQIQIKG